MTARRKLPAGVDRRASGQYRVRVFHAGERHTATFDTELEAVAWRDAVRRGDRPAVPAPRVVVAPRVAVSVLDVAVRLVDGMLAGTVRTKTGTVYKPSVVEKYEGNLRLFVVPRIGAMDVRDVTRRDVQRLVDGVAAEHDAESARKALTALRVLFRLADQDGDVDVTPCVAIRQPVDAAEADDARQPRFLEAGEVDRLVAVAEAVDARLGQSLALPAILVSVESGLRSGELLGLLWRHVDLDAGVVQVRQSLHRKRPGGRLVYGPPKTRHSRRDVPLPAASVAVLRRHYLASGRPGAGVPVFAGVDRRPWSWSTLDRRLEAACEAAKLAGPWPVWHDLRHTFATLMLAAGVQERPLAELLGHGSTAQVRSRYGHALPSAVAAAAQMLTDYRKARTA